MSETLHILHEPSDAELVSALIEFLGQSLPTCTVTCSHLDGHAVDAATAIEQAAAVVGVLTPSALGAAAVPFELGLARGQGKPLVAVRSELVDASILSLPIPSYLIAVAEDPDSLIEVFREVAEMIEQPFAPDAPVEEPPAEQAAEESQQAEPDPEASHLEQASEVESQVSAQEEAAVATAQVTQIATQEAEEAAEQVPPGEAAEAQPLSPAVPARPVTPREATQPRWSSPPVPPPMKSVAPGATSVPSPAAAGVSAAPAPRTSAAPANATAASASAETGATSPLPSRADALEAGSLFAQCMLSSEPTSVLAASLDPVFGTFMTALGANWATLRTMEDLDMWVEMAENVISNLEPEQAHLGPWYGIGFELSTLLSLSGMEPEEGDKEALDEMWTQSMEKLSALSQQAQLSVASEAVLEGMLENLRDPGAGRDTESILQLQGTLKQHAAQDNQA